MDGVFALFTRMPHTGIVLRRFAGHPLARLKIKSIKQGIGPGMEDMREPDGRFQVKLAKKAGVEQPAISTV
jgi:hypothetical protein